MYLDGSSDAAVFLQWRWKSRDQVLHIVPYVFSPSRLFAEIDPAVPLCQPLKLCKLTADLYEEFFGKNTTARDAVMSQVRCNLLPRQEILVLMMCTAVHYAGHINCFIRSCRFPCSHLY